MSAKSGAEDAAAGAAFSRDVAARVANGGSCDNPIFAENLNGFYTNSGNGTLSRVATGGKYGACVEYSNSGTDESAPQITWNYTNNGGLGADEVEAVEVDFEVEMISGVWSSAEIELFWRGGTNAIASVKIGDAITGTNGKIQRVTAVVERPASFVAGGTDNDLRVRYFGNRSGGTNGHTARIHRFDFRVLSKTASALIQQQALVDLQGNAAASLVMRAKAGTSDGSVEIVAADNVNGGSASKVKMTGSEIELDGITVFSGNELKSSNFVDGAAGWRIKNGGDAQFNNLIVRGSLTANAASNGGESIAYTSKTRIGGEDQGVVLTSLSLGPTDYNEAWLIGYAGEIRGEAGAANSNYLIAKIRKKSGSTWSSWETLWTSPTEGGNVWTPYYYGQIFMGDFDDVEIGLAAFPSRNYSLWSVNNVYNLSLYARVVKR